MKNLVLIGLILTGTALYALQSPAQILARIPLQKTRWAYPENHATNLDGVLAEMNTANGSAFVVENFKLAEDRSMAGMQFKFYQQLVDQVPVKNAGIRIWSNESTQDFIQMVAFLQNPETPGMQMTRKKLNLLNAPLIKESRWSLSTVLNMAKGDLNKVVNFSQAVNWENERLVTEVTVFGRDRKVIYKFDAMTFAFIDKKIHLFPRADAEPADDEWTVFGKAYQVSEEYDGEYGRRYSGATPETVELKYLKSYFFGTAQDWSPLLAQKELYNSKYDEEKAKTPEGIAAGYWSEASVKKMIADVTVLFPRMSNQVPNGARFIGRYVTVNVDPLALTTFGVQNFSKKYSTGVSRNWSRVNENGVNDWKITLAPTVYGNVFASSDELFGRRAEFEILPSTKSLIEDGFDEMQVYWSVNTWFETLHNTGFVDSELSTRPIIANLFNPDIESRDNAFYDSDTINFSTYTERNPNEARNLITIWHELGHGLMDRLQGSSGFDNGGLSEGIADFAAEMVLRGFNQGELHPAYENRRINNRTAFYLTNEGHDAGEAYGGSLKDILEQSIQAEGPIGAKKASDLVMDAMRLTRRFANLNLNEWYDALVLADRLGKPGLRASGELASKIHHSFSARNFIENHDPETMLNIYYENQVVDEESLGSRYNPVPVTFPGADVQVPQLPDQKQLSVQLRLEKIAGEFQFPLKVKVSFKETNALQGAIKFLDEADQVYEIKSVDDVIDITMTVTKACDFANTESGSCVDFANVYVYSSGATKPFAKKRFYVKIANEEKK